MSDIVDRVRRIWSMGPDDFFSELLQYLEDQEAEIERLRSALNPEALRSAFVAGTKIGQCPGTEDLEFDAWLATQDPNAGCEQ